MLRTKCLRTLAGLTYYKNRHFSRSQSFLKPADDAELKITQACVDRISKIVKNGQFLRVTVDGGGCSGFQYSFDLDTNLNKDDDNCFEKNGAKIVIDKMSFGFLKGSTVDYHEELIRSAFRIIDNPQAEGGCSCGASFTVKVT